MQSQIIANLPWKDIIKNLPHLIDAATGIWKSSTSRAKTVPIKASDEPKAQLAAIVERLESLELSEVDQANLIKELLEQFQGISIGLNEVSRRANIAMALGLGALVISVVILVWQFVRTAH